MEKNTPEVSDTQDMLVREVQEAGDEWARDAAAVSSAYHTFEDMKSWLEHLREAFASGDQAEVEKKWSVVDSLCGDLDATFAAAPAVENYHRSNRLLADKVIERYDFLPPAKKRLLLEAAEVAFAADGLEPAVHQAIGILVEATRNAVTHKQQEAV